MFHVDAGGEYRGETYLWCDVCSGGRVPIRDDEPGLFEGDSMLELAEWMAAHLHPDRLRSDLGK
jgi:hypothetical protein